MAPAAYAVLAAESALPAAMAVLEALRARGVSVLQHAGSPSMKNQMKKADASGAKAALVFDEARLTVKPLRDRDAQPVSMPLDATAADAALAALQSLA